VISPGTAKGLMPCVKLARSWECSLRPRSTNCTTTIEPFTSAAALLLADSAAPRRGPTRQGGHRPRRNSQLLIRQVVTSPSTGRTRTGANVLRRPAGSPKVSVELIQDSGLRSTGPRLKQLLLDHGIPSVSSLAELATEADSAPACGSTVVVEGSKVEIASGTPVRGRRDVRRALAAGSRPGDGLGGARWIDWRAPSPRHRDRPRRALATVVLVNGGRVRTVGVLASRGATRLRQLLADQLRRTFDSGSPAATTRAGCLSCWR